VVHRGDIFDVLPDVEADLAYFDPPYGSNNEKMPPSRVRYAAYYHLWTTVCLNDKPAVFGKARRRSDTSDTVARSSFEEFRRSESGLFIAVEAIERLLREARAKHILLSYSSGGRATAEELNAVISTVGRMVEVLEIDYHKNVMAGMRWTNEWIAEAEAPNREFLFLIEKS
jgi:adenine-specific DNA-methyltransferase